MAFHGKIEIIETGNSDKLTIHFAEKKHHTIAEKNAKSFFFFTLTVIEKENHEEMQSKVKS